MKRFAVPFIFLSLGFHWGFAQEDLVNVYQQAGATWQAKNYESYLPLSSRILEQMQHPAILFRRSISLAALGREKESEAVLKKLIAMGITYQVDTVTVLRNRFSANKLQKIASAFASNKKYIDRSDTTFVLPDETFIPEGLASSSTGDFFLGSLSQWKIVSIRSSQEAIEFTGPKKESGLWSVVGIKVDDQRKELWACSATEIDSLKGYSGLLCFDLNTKALKKKYVLDNKEGEHFFNDLTISKSGDVYLTDSKAGRLYRYQRESDEFKVLLNGFIYPNGITLNDEGDQLYVADLTGIHSVNLSTLKKQSISPGEQTYTVGIDGLYYYHGDLIAIQDTGLQDDRVVQFKLDGNKIISASTLQFMRNDFVIPTTGTVRENRFYYIANSHLRNLKPDMSLIRKNELRKPVVLNINLINH